MNPDKWKKIDELFDEALDVSDILRRDFVNEKAADDIELRDAVLQLLEAQSESKDFMDKPAMQVAANVFADDVTEVAFPSLINSLIDGYKVERLIGSGGMGEVYLAYDEKLQRKIALKILPKDFGTDDERVKRFKAEARAISSLNHPGIVTVYDVGNFEGINYIATEYVEGKTLRELPAERPALREILQYSIQICDALSAAHDKGVIHRDIKPENIMIRNDGYAKILDFGLVKLTETTPDIQQELAATSKGMIIGTPAYMSPMQISDEKIDRRTDLWSFGVVLYELLAGVNPFKGTDRNSTFRAILSKEPANLTEVKAELPPELDIIMNKLLEKDPDYGYQTFSDLRADIKKILRQIDSGITSSGRSFIQPTSQTVKTGLSRSSTITLILLPVLAISASAIVYWLYFTKTTPPDWTKAKIIQLTTEQGTEHYPTLSPDGRSFAYAADKNGKFDIFLRRIESNTELNLTESSNANDTMPSFSPDGEMIAFRSDRDSGGIFIMSSIGGEAKRISDHGFSPSWSPDGKKLVVAGDHQDMPSVRTPSSLSVIDIESGETKDLGGEYFLQPAWSPNGKLIAFWFFQNHGKRAIATIPADGGEPVVVADESNTNWNPVWSPDGQFIYFSSDRSGSLGIWRIRVDENSGRPVGSPETVPTPASINRHMSFSTAGDKMVFVQTDVSSNLRSAALDPTTEKIIGDIKFLTSGDIELSTPDLSPDGSVFAARLIKRTNDSIVLINSDGSRLRDITASSNSFNRYPRWSADGKHIAFASDRSGNYEIWTMNSNGSDLKQRTFFETSSVSFPVWSSDGKQIAFDSIESIMMLDTDREHKGEQLKPLPAFPGEGLFRLWDWSPDGKKLAGIVQRGEKRGITIYHLENETYENISNHNSIPRWLPDNRRLIFEFDGKAYIADTVTKEVREVFPQINEHIRNIAISRDGKLLYYTNRTSESNIWMLDMEQTN